MEKWLLSTFNGRILEHLSTFILKACGFSHANILAGCSDQSCLVALKAWSSTQKVLTLLENVSSLQHSFST